MTDIQRRPLNAAIEDAMFDHSVEDALRHLYLVTLDRPYTVTYSYDEGRDRFDFHAEHGGEVRDTDILSETLGDGGWKAYVKYLDGQFPSQAASS
ncbi:hypothetical protein [Brevundimonas sp.]|uniref:hypothetical protein n=1 Tax=Brevundimonas sp. TaxID=1871086 RepID=UPI00289D6325|nr:hypothetical protein [Brevundimonas sp.]